MVSGVAILRLIAAAAVTILNVEPGGYRPVVAIGPCASAAGFCATARMRPVDGCTTTIAIWNRLVALTARCAAVCTVRDRLSEIAGDGSGAWSARTSASTRCSVSTDTTRDPARPGDLAARRPS